MTNINIQPENAEGDFILDQYFAASNAIESYNREVRAKKAELEANFSIVEQALKDYMEGNGIVKYTSKDNHTVSMGWTTNTVITCSVDELPERFIRTKKEPNKILINEAVKAGEKFNWLEYESTKKLTVK